MSKSVPSARFNETGAYLDLPSVEALILFDGDSDRISVLRARSPVGKNGLTNAHPLEDAFLLSLQLIDYEGGLSVDGKPLPLLRQAQGEIAAYDYRRSWEGDLASAFDCVNFHLPRTLMSELGSDPGTCVIDDLNLNAGQTVDDAVVYGLARSLLPALSRPREVNALFTSHVATALSAHIVSTYADFARPRDRKAGTLAPWQERRAKDMISADITGSLGLADIAAECGLSASHFGRAFRKTTGFPPHRWLLFHRIEISKSLLLDTRRTIAEIADTCGFADQSHFSRVFARFTGATPAAWRRRCAT